MKNKSVFLLTLALTAPLHADALLSSWMTSQSGKYARVFTTDAARTAGTSVTAWTTQTQPAYAGVMQIAYTTDWVYIKSSGLGLHIMGPWYGNAAHDAPFPNWPKNQAAAVGGTWRFPRVVAVPGTHTNTGLGAIGYFVDGVAMFDGRDGFSWNGTTEVGNGNGSWERDAWINEGVTFDPGYAHQEQTGTHHYHANPIALRYLLGDHVNYTAAAGTAANGTYIESTASVTKHSPILGWVRDGSPVYGPHGYDDPDPLHSSTVIRRMVSGYVLRNGSNGTDNLTATGRTTIPAWATRAAQTAQTGPPIATYPLGRYMQDKAYLGDLGRTPGVDFDLDEYNGRFCKTPEYPAGIYAYFVTINADGTPAFPYIIGRSYHGTGTGTGLNSGGPATLAGTETTTFTGGAAVQEAAAMTGINAANGNVGLTWNSVEGGTYKVEAGTNLSNWTTLTSSQAAAAGTNQTNYSENGAATSNSRRFYRVTRTALAAYDGGAATGSGPPTAATGAATAITNTTATLNGTITANTLNTAVTFEYGLTTSYGSTVAATPATVTGSTATGVAASVTGLTANALYHFRVTGVNSSGTTNGSDLTFTATTPTGGGTGILNVSPASGTIGSPFTLTVNLDPAFTPPVPPQNIAVNSVSIGATAGANRMHVTQYQVTSNFTILSGPAGPQTVTVTFLTPGGQTLTYTLAGGFTVN